MAMSIDDAEINTMLEVEADRNALVEMSDLRVVNIDNISGNYGEEGSQNDPYVYEG